MSGRKPSPMWDRLVFNKIKEKLGGRVRLMTSGASPLSPDVMDFLRVCFGCPVLEGYGMTKTSCVISSMDESDTLTGHVGSPNPACEIKLVDVPEMNYTYEYLPHPCGEICVRGPIIFHGYYKDEIQTCVYFKFAFNESSTGSPQAMSLPIGNPFRMLLPKGSYLAPKLLALVNSFEETLAERLKKLKPRDREDVLSLSWMRLALESLCGIHADIKTLITTLEPPVCNWDDKWIDVYLDNSVNLLDICIAFRL